VGRVVVEGSVNSPVILPCMFAASEIEMMEDAPCADVDARVVGHLADVRERLAQLQALESELQRLTACCAGGGVIGDCRIIEALSRDESPADADPRPNG